MSSSLFDLFFCNVSLSQVETMQKPPRWCPWKSTAKSDLDSFLSIVCVDKLVPDFKIIMQVKCVVKLVDDLNRRDKKSQALSLVQYLPYALH